LHARNFDQKRQGRRRIESQISLLPDAAAAGLMQQHEPVDFSAGGPQIHNKRLAAQGEAELSS